MAFKPSNRRNRPNQEVEPDLTPIMNLMVVLIPLLLTSVQFIKLGIIELNLPPSKASMNESLVMDKEPALPRLDLSISITHNGFTISSAMAILRNEAGVSVPKKQDNTYDYEMLNQQLLLIKTGVENRFADTKKVIIMAEPDIDYQTLVSTMDAARNPFVTDTVRFEEIERVWYPNEELFSEVSISAGVVY